MRTLILYCAVFLLACASLLTSQLIVAYSPGVPQPASQVAATLAEASRADENSQAFLSRPSVLIVLGLVAAVAVQLWREDA